MRASVSGHLLSTDISKARDVRLSTVRFRGAVAVRVTSIAAPTSQATDISLAQELGRVSRSTRASVSADLANAASAPATNSGDLALKDEADYERAISNGFATTSTTTPPPTSGGRKRTTNAGSVSSAKRFNSTIKPEDFQPRAYTAKLSGATSVKELQKLFNFGRKYDINAIHVATLWTRLAKIVAAAECRTDAVNRRSSDSSSNAGSSSSSSIQGVQNASASAPSPPSTRTHAPKQRSARPQGQQQPHPQDQQKSLQGEPQQQEEPQQEQKSQPQLDPVALAAFVQALQDYTTPQQLERMEARGLANVLWAAAKLKPQPESVEGAGTELLEGSVAQEPSLAASSALSSAAAAADGGQQADASAVDAVGGVQHQPRQRPLRVRGGKKAFEAAKAAAEAAAAAASGSARQQPQQQQQQEEPRTTLVSEALLDAWCAAAGSKLRDFSMQDLSNVTWALGRLGYHPRGLFLKQLSIALLKELPRADRPQQLSNVLLGLALLQFVPPITDFWAAMWGAVGRLVLGDQRSPDVQAVSNTLWALSQLKVHCAGDMAAVPPELVSKAVFRAVQWGDKLGDTQLQDVLTSLHPLGFEPSEYQASRLLQLSFRVLPACDAQALSNVYMSLLNMHVRPDGVWMRAFLVAFKRQLGGASAEATARLLYGLGIRGTGGRAAWMPMVWVKLQAVLPSMRAADIAFAVLGIRAAYPGLARRMRRAASDEGTDMEDVAEAEERVGQQQQEEEEEEDGVAGAKAGGEAAVVDEEGEAAEPSTSVSSLASAEGAEAKEEESEGRNHGRVALPKKQVTAPSRELLAALRRRWDDLGQEAQLAVKFDYRANVQEFLDAALL